MLKVGDMDSLSDFVVEVFLVVVVSIVTPWIVLFLHQTKKKQGRAIANILTLFPLVFTVVLRLLMRSLPA